MRMRSLTSMKTQRYLFLIILLLHKKPSASAFLSQDHHPIWKHQYKEGTVTSTELNGEKEARPGSMRAATQEQGRVPYGESSRQYRRTTYKTYNNWIDHRASFGIVDNLKGIFFSGVIRQLKNEVLLVTCVALFLVMWNGFVGNSDGTVLPHLALPSQPFLLCSPSLGLLLVFRTNTSYSRWLEARMKWSTIQTHSVNLARMASTFMPTTMSPTNVQVLERLITMNWLLPRTLMNRFLGSSDEAAFEKEMLDSNIGGTELMEDILKAPDRPMLALLELSFALNDLPIDEKRRLEIDKSIIIIGECISSCERIFTSPVPLVYTRHTARFLSLWMLLLPFPLYDQFVERGSILTPQVFMESSVLIPAVAVLAFFLFGVQELSLALEEPFSVLNMQSFCDDILRITTDMQNRAVAKPNGSRR